MGGTETILLIDDEQNIRSVIRSMFERYGYTVLEGVDGEEGLGGIPAGSGSGLPWFCWICPCRE